MLALSMISLGTGEDPQKIRRAISSVIKHVNAVFITLTGPREELGEAEKVLKEIEEQTMKRIEVSYERALHKVTESQVKWLTDFMGYEPEGKVGDKLFLFDVARNYNLKQIPKDYKWILWMDTDDVFRGAEELPALLADAEKEGVEAIYLNYVYQAEIENNKVKNVVIEHLRERIIKNEDLFEWVAPIHETLIEKRLTKKKDYNWCDLLHLAEHENRVKSLHRNIKNLEYSIWKTEGKDPRPLYYLGKAYFDLRTPETDEKARKLIYLYLRGPNPSGWTEERSQACAYLADIYKRQNKPQEAVIEGMNALMEHETPEIFINIANTYMMKGEWSRALMWAELAVKLKPERTTLVNNPKDVKGKLLEILYNCNLNLSNIDTAYKYGGLLLEMYPQEQSVQSAWQYITALKEQRDVTRNIADLSSHLMRSGQVDKIKPLLAAVPEIAFQTPYVQDLYKKTFPPKYWDDKSVAIVCGQGISEWTGKSLDGNDGFVGGSEEAVILLSKELVKLGYKVTVYNSPGEDEGMHDGVEYKWYYKFNVLDHFNILVSWRYPQLADMELNYKKLYLWAHDILNPADFPPERVEKFTKIIVQSPWHRQNISNVPDDKVLVSSNGIL